MAVTFPFIVFGFLFVLALLGALPFLLIGLITGSSFLKRIGLFGVCGGISGLLLCAVGVVLVLTGMFIDEVAGPYTRTEPKLSDLAGVYHPTENSMTYIKSEGYDSAEEITIVLGSDGDLQLINIPDMYYNDFGKAKGKFVSNSGQWELDSEDRSVKHWSLNFITGKCCYGGVMLKNQKPPYVIELIIGDPDCGDFLLFAKAKE